MKKLFAMIVLLCLIFVQAAAPCLAFEELSKGSKGDAVVELQNRLNELGYSVGKPDGDYGGKTEKAVKKFQVDNDLDVTGIVDEKTYSALFSSEEETNTEQNDTTNDYTAISHINRLEIKDIWRDYPGISILTLDGDIISIESGNEPTIEVKASGIDTVLHGPQDLFIRKDGSVTLGVGYNHYELDEEWHDIVLASAGFDHAVGLRSDGTWVVAGSYADGECDVDDWTDIEYVEVGNDHTVGLKDDGTVVATGNNKYGQCNVSNWSEIVQISVGYTYTLGLKRDGTVVATGYIEGEQFNVSDWVEVKYVYAGDDAIFGLSEDGKIYTTMDSYFKGAKNCRLIPRKFFDTDAIRIEGSYTELLSEGQLLIINKDNTIDLFGHNKKNECEKLMDIILPRPLNFNTDTP